MNFRFDHPGLLALLLLALPIIWLGRRSLAALESGRRTAAISLRVAVLVVLVLMLAGLQGVRWHEELTVVAVVDRSDSVRRLVRPPDRVPWAPAMQPGEFGVDAAASPKLGAGVTSVEQWVNAWFQRAAADRRPDDQLGLVTFDARPTVRVLPSTTIDLSSSAAVDPSDGTDIAGAIRQGLSLFPPDSGKRLVLVSDGNDNISGSGSAVDSGGDAAQAGDVLAAAREARASHVPIDVIPLTYQLDREVMVDGVFAPAQAVEGQTVSIRVVLRGTQATPGWLYLRHDGLPLGADDTAVRGAAPRGGHGGGIRIDPRSWSEEVQAQPEGGDASGGGGTSGGNSGGGGGRYVRVVVVELPLPHVGINRFTAVFEPEKGYDTIDANNRGESFTLVRGRSRVLIVDDDGAKADTTLTHILAQMGVAVDTVTGREVPDEFAGLLRYDAVILQNVPAGSIAPAQQALLADYVTELGGGLMMLGGINGFGAGEWADTPVDRVLPVDSRLPGQPPKPVGALLIVIDRSGSMSEPASPTASKLDTVIEAAIQATLALHARDMVQIVTFDTRADVVVPLQVIGPNLPQIVSSTRRIPLGGGTDIYIGMARAYEAFITSPLAEKATARHMILLTDGQSEGGDYKHLVAEMKEQNITVSTVGVGDDVNPQFMTWLAQIGGGIYHPITDATRIPQIFVDEAHTLRRTFVREGDFRPRLLPTGSPITQGLGTFPILRGFVDTSPKRQPDGKSIDPRVFMPLVGPDAQPLLAHWQAGLGRAAAFTSDASNQWAAAWLGWDHDQDFWARTIRTIARPAQSREMELTTSMHGSTLHLKLDAPAPAPGSAPGSAPGNAPGTTPVAEPDSSTSPIPHPPSHILSPSGSMQVVGTIVRPNGTIQQRVVLHQTAPALYEGDVPAPDEGNYIVSLITQDGQGRRSALVGGANRPPGAELRSLSANGALLRRVAEITGGRELDIAQPATAALFDRQGVEPSRSTSPLWRPLLVLLLALFLADVAARRVAWDVAKTWRWVVDRFAQAGASPQVRAEATLASLKSRATQVQEGVTRKAAVPPPTRPPPAAPRRPAQARPAPATAAHGSTKAPQPAAPPASTASVPPAADGRPEPIELSEDITTPKAAPASGDATTSRLLDAKRRMRERRKDDADA